MFCSHFHCTINLTHVLYAFVQGENLHHLLHHRKHSLTPNRVIFIASQIAKGMGYLHARQIVHRDLKTRNIFIETNDKAVIADFALFNFVNFCKLAN